MKQKIKRSVAFLLALGTLGSTAWASDKTSRWENFCDAMQAEVDKDAIKQAPPPDVTPFQEAQPIAPSMTQVFCTIRVMGSKIYCGAMVGLQPEYMSVIKLQLQKAKMAARGKHKNLGQYRIMLPLKLWMCLRFSISIACVSLWIFIRQKASESNK